MQHVAQAAFPFVELVFVAAAEEDLAQFRDAALEDEAEDQQPVTVAFVALMASVTACLLTVPNFGPMWR